MSFSFSMTMKPAFHSHLNFFEYKGKYKSAISILNKLFFFVNKLKDILFSCLKVLLFQTQVLELNHFKKSISYIVQ